MIVDFITGPFGRLLAIIAVIALGWLLRRLALLVHDAHRIHDAAAAALAATAPGATARRRMSGVG